MAQTWEQKRVAVEREADSRMVRELGDLAEGVAQVVRRYGAGRERMIPNTRQVRERLSLAVWDGVVKPYFIGTGINPLRGAEPQSPYTRAMVDGIRAGIRVQAERQVQMVERYAGRDAVVLDWLTGARPVRLREMGDRRLWYDPFHLFVYGNEPYRLSDRVWRTSVDVRARIDAVLDYHIPRGTAAADGIAAELVQYLTPGERPRMTRTPYGNEGSYSARRLARTEVTAAAGRSVVNASAVNPFVEGIRWGLSLSHPKRDRCDDHASGGPNGDGVYAVGNVPAYPDHPHCLCTLVPVVVRNPAQVVAELRAAIEAQTPAAVQLQGAFNLAWLVEALVTGAFVWTMFEGAEGS
jgi:hypothetical protein